MGLTPDGIAANSPAPGPRQGLSKDLLSEWTPRALKEFPKPQPPPPAAGV